MEIYFEEQTCDISVESIVNDLDKLIQRKEDRDEVDPEEFKLLLQKIRIIKQYSMTKLMLNNLS